MLQRSQQELAQDFAALHRARPGFIMPNAWDAGSAIILAQEGFKAIATTSAGIAFALGKADYDVRDVRAAVSREEMFERIREITGVVDIPVNGDMQDGFGEAPEAVAETIRMSIEAGLAGGNIEDKRAHTEGLYDEALSVERIRTAREAIDTCGNAFVLCARTDALQSTDPLRLDAAIRRLNRYREAGADCLYAPGAESMEMVQRMLREVRGPINVVMGLGNASGNAAAYLEAGVQRISLGGSIARAALGFVRTAVREIRDQGTVSYAANQIPQRELNQLFTGVRRAGRTP